MSKTVQILGKSFQTYIDATTIQQRLKELAQEIDKAYFQTKPLFIAILNGSFIFAADFYRYITLESEIAFVKLQSYQGTESSGIVTTAIGLNTNLKDRHIIILEDIIDTGNTLYSFLPSILKEHPASLKIVTLLNKKEARIAPLEPDYSAFEIPNTFVVGYGLDYDGIGRNIPDIMQLDEDYAP